MTSRLRPLLVVAYLLAGLLAEGFHAHGGTKPACDSPAIRAGGQIDRASERCSSCEYLLAAVATPTVPHGRPEVAVEALPTLRVRTTPVVDSRSERSRAPPVHA